MKGKGRELRRNGGLVKVFFYDVWLPSKFPGICPASAILRSRLHVRPGVSEISFVGS